MLAERSMERTSRWSKGPDAPILAPVMSIEPIQPPRYPVPSAPGAVAATRAAGTSFAETLTAAKPADAVPPEPVPLEPGPTQDALTAVQVAAQAYEVLKRSGRELRFEATDGVMRIEVYDGLGRLVRAIPPNEALALAVGEPSWQA
jgi:hypothetical protein